MPLTFSFRGSFFDLADFFHRMKRFVRLASQDRLKVGGRLMTIDGFSLDSTSFPKIKADISSTVYLAPKSEGATAGATSNGPSTTTEASSGGSQNAAANAPAPTSTPSSGAPR